MGTKRMLPCCLLIKRLPKDRLDHFLNGAFIPTSSSQCIVEALYQGVVAFCSIFSGKALRLDIFDEDFRDIGLAIRFTMA
jgi:hypothetical protein